MWRFQRENSGFLGNRGQTHCAWVRGWVVGLVWAGTFRTPVAPKSDFSRNTHSCGWQGSSSPSNFQLPTSSRKPTFVQARPNLPPTLSPMHNVFDFDYPRNQSFPARTATWATFPLMWSTMPTRSPTPESGHSRGNNSRSRVPLYMRFQQEIIFSRHFSYPRSS